MYTYIYIYIYGFLVVVPKVVCTSKWFLPIFFLFDADFLGRMLTPFTILRWWQDGDEALDSVEECARVENNHIFSMMIYGNPVIPCEFHLPVLRLEKLYKSSRCRQVTYIHHYTQSTHLVPTVFSTQISTPCFRSSNSSMSQWVSSTVCPSGWVRYDSKWPGFVILQVLQNNSCWAAFAILSLCFFKHHAKEDKVMAINLVWCFRRTFS